MGAAAGKDERRAVSWREGAHYKEINTWRFVPIASGKKFGDLHTKIIVESKIGNPARRNLGSVGLG